MEPQLTKEEESKDTFFRRIAAIGDEMMASHGKDFATGAFVLAARWINESEMNKPSREDNKH
jgi:hypothetical protein